MNTKDYPQVDAPKSSPKQTQNRLVQRVAWFLRYYPVTVLLLAPYVLLVIPLGLVHHNPDTMFIVQLAFLSVLGAAVVETFVRPRHRAGVDRPMFPHAYRIARLVTVASIVADLTAAYHGRGTILTQLSGEVASSPMANLAAMFAGWRYVAVALLLYAVKTGGARVTDFYRWAGALLVGQLLVVAMTMIAAPFIAYLSFVAAAGAVVGVVRARVVVTAICLLLLVWPAIFALRNELRLANGVRVSSNVTAEDRLRLDRQVSLLRQYDVPVDIGQPQLADVMGYVIVPRVLDPDRPALSTGVKINQYLGGGPTSAYSFLAMGNVYFLTGPIGLLIFYTSWSGLAIYLRSRVLGPYGMCLFCFILAGPLAWSSTYPESMIGAGQNLVAAAPVFALLMVTRVRPGHRTAAVGPPSRPAVSDQFVL